MLLGRVHPGPHHCRPEYRDDGPSCADTKQLNERNELRSAGKIADQETREAAVGERRDDRSQGEGESEVAVLRLVKDTDQDNRVDRDCCAGGGLAQCEDDR